MLTMNSYPSRPSGRLTIRLDPGANGPMIARRKRIPLSVAGVGQMRSPALARRSPARLARAGTVRSLTGNDDSSGLPARHRHPMPAFCVTLCPQPNRWGPFPVRVFWVEVRRNSGAAMSTIETLKAVCRETSEAAARMDALGGGLPRCLSYVCIPERSDSGQSACGSCGGSSPPHAAQRHQSRAALRWQAIIVQLARGSRMDSLAQCVPGQSIRFGAGG
jgi:hypothetical protein